MPLRSLGMAVCAVHREIMVDEARGLELCGRCLDESAVSPRRKVIVDWPPEMAGWLERNVPPGPSDRWNICCTPIFVQMNHN